MVQPKYRSFQTTRWSRVICAGDPKNPQAQAALEELLQQYWYPIYSFIRRSGHPHDAAMDLTQGFMVFALERGTFQRADPQKGRFRTFILSCLGHFIVDDYRHRTAAMRGGTEGPVELDGLEAEARYALEPVDTETPEQLFTRKLAAGLLDDAMRELEADCAADGHAEKFAALRGYLDHEGVDETYGELSAQLGVPVNTLKSYVRRWRKNLREILTERVLQIVADEDDVRSEKVVLEQALRGLTSGR